MVKKKKVSKNKRINRLSDSKKANSSNNKIKTVKVAKKIISKKETNGDNKKKSIEQIAQEIRDLQIKEQRKPLVETLEKNKDSNKKKSKSEENFIKTGIDGLDELFEQGVPKGNSILIAGGAGSGKTILCLQMLKYHAMHGDKCLYMSFEEPEEKLVKHMEDFGWPIKDLIKRDKIRIVRMNPFDITRNVDALLAKEKGELLIEVDPIITPKDFKNPEIIIIDSLTAIGSAFAGKDDSYRIYIEQLFRFLEKIKATSFLITETEQIPKIFSKTGVEEFLADGVIVLYNMKHENIRENAIEVLKLRGASHKKALVAMQITKDGIVVYPEQEVFSDTD